MDKEYIERIQEKIIHLLKTQSDDLPRAAKYQCSEITRLVGCWILNKYPEFKVQIYKGILSAELAHDILVVEDGRILFLIDPTVWQIFPDNGSIVIGSAGNMSEAASMLQKKYGGTWKVSEVMQACDENYKQELLNAIKNNKQKI